ncbi:MAG: hypothetical protein HQ492_08555 [Woeseiaceae bacterium]|nr:hypothetical protein [Woeseiaceae bacterium]
MRFPDVNGWLPLIYLVILGGGWGLHFSLIKIAAESGLSYSGIAAVTTVGAAGLLLLIAIYLVVMETVADFDSD